MAVSKDTKKKKTSVDDEELQESEVDAGEETSADVAAEEKTERSQRKKLFAKSMSEG
jgi:hypothetical protein